MFDIVAQLVNSQANPNTENRKPEVVESQGMNQSKVIKESAEKFTVVQIRYGSLPYTFTSD